MLSLSGVSYRLPGRRRSRGRLLLDKIELVLAPGSSVAVVGPSGVGKSTLLSLCLGLADVDEGQIVVADRVLGEMSRRHRALHRGEHVGMVFQGGELIAELTPLENVALPLLMAGRPGDEAWRRAREALRLLALREHVDETPTEALSGGERQRVAVARAVVGGPTLLLADEPTGFLDPDTRDVVADHLFGLPARVGCGLVVVTHDAEVASRADRVFRLLDGCLELAR